VAILIPHAIDALGVLPMYGFQGAVQIAHSLRDQDQMDVVRHQTVRDDLDGEWHGMPAQQFQVRNLIAATEEHVRPMITALGYMMRNPGKNEARTSWHDRKISVRPMSRIDISRGKRQQT